MGATASGAFEGSEAARKVSRLKRAWRFANEHSAVFTVFVGFLTLVASTGLDAWKLGAERDLMEAQEAETKERTLDMRHARVSNQIAGLDGRIGAYERSLALLTPEEQGFVQQARAHENGARRYLSLGSFDAAERSVADGYGALARVQTLVPNIPTPTTTTTTPLPGAAALLGMAAALAVALGRRRRR